MRVKLFVEVIPLGGAAPIEMRFYSAAPDGSWEAFDRSPSADLEQPCTRTVFTSPGSCVAVFQVPRDATTVRLTARSKHQPLPGGEVAAGVATLHIQGETRH